MAAMAAVAAGAAGLFSSLLQQRQRRQELEYAAEKDKLDRQIQAQKNLQELYGQGGRENAGQLNNIVGSLTNIMGR